MGVVLFVHLSFDYFFSQDSSSINSIQLSARDRAVAARESVKLSSKNILLNKNEPTINHQNETEPFCIIFQDNLKVFSDQRLMGSKLDLLEQNFINL